MLTTEETKNKKKCSYSYEDYHCPFDAEDKEEFCIFHLPVEKKDPLKFWKHLANFLWNCLPIGTPEMMRMQTEHFWIIDERDNNLLEYYRDKVDKSEGKLIGFIFPPMDDRYNFRKFKFSKMNFLAAQFSGKADFGLAKFRENVYFSRVNFGEEANFKETKFDEDVYFIRAYFSKDVFFNVAKFVKDVSFSEAVLSGYAEFKQTSFSGEADFSKVQFLSESYFGGTLFANPGNFQQAQFSKETDFVNVQFSNDVNFYEAKFSGSAHFCNAQFSGEAFFHYAQFLNRAYFNLSQFSGDVHFENAQFSEKADFRDTQFLGVANFEDVQFSEGVYFMRAKFGNRINFAGSLILGNSIFIYAHFYKEANFTNAIAKFLDFEGCEIYSFLRFREIQKLKEARIVSITERIEEWDSDDKKKVERLCLEKALALDVKKVPPVILLRDIKFWENGHLLLEDFDVSRVSFWQTNFHIIQSRIDFIRVDWGSQKSVIDDIYTRQEYKNWEKKTKEKWLTENELHRIYKPIEETKNCALEIERCYRQIRLYYETRGEHPDAGDFYKHEMEVRGKRLKGFIKFLHWLYGLFSKYGESPARAFISLLVILGIFSFFYLLIGFKYNDNLISFNLRNYSLALLFAINNLIPGYIRMQAFQSTSPWTILTLVFEVIFGITILTLFLLAVRRRFRRESH